MLHRLHDRPRVVLAHTHNCVIQLFIEHVIIYGPRDHELNDFLIWDHELNDLCDFGPRVE